MQLLKRIRLGHHNNVIALLLVHNLLRQDDKFVCAVCRCEGV